MDTTRSTSWTIHTVLLIIALLISGALTKLPSPLWLPGGLVVLAAFLVALCFDAKIEEADYNVHVDATMRSAAIYGLANFAGWMLGTYNVTPEVLSLSPLVTGLIASYVVASGIDYLVVPSDKSNDKALNLDGSTAFVSWIVYTGLVVGVGGTVSQIFREQWLAGVLVVLIMLAIAVSVDRFRSEEVGYHTLDHTGRGYGVYGCLTIVALASQLPFFGAPSLPTVLVIAYAVATVIEIVLEILSSDVFVPASSFTSSRA